MLVIGAGLSGLIAAAAAAPNARVTVVAEGRGSLYLSTGFIDFLGYYPGESNLPLKETGPALQHLVQRQPEHPYVVVGEEGIEKAFSFFLRVMEAAGYPYVGSWRTNRFLPTGAGTLNPTALVSLTAKADWEKYNRILVAGFREMSDFYPALTAENLDRVGEFGSGPLTAGRFIARPRAMYWPLGVY